MAYTTIQAYRSTDGTLHETEIDAITDDIRQHKLDSDRQDIMDCPRWMVTNAPFLIPLLQRVVAIDSAGRAEDKRVREKEGPLPVAKQPRKSATSESDEVREENPMCWQQGYSCFVSVGIKADNPYDLEGNEEHRNNHIAWNYGFEYAKREAESMPLQADNGDSK